MVEYTFDEVTANNRTPGACWLIIHEQVYDVTSYLDDHPGGRNILLSARGRDATHDFEAARHPRRVRETLMEEYCRGDADMTTVPGDRNQDRQPAFMPPMPPMPPPAVGYLVPVILRGSQLLVILGLAAYSGFFLETLVILVIGVVRGYLIIRNY